jgi:uncharacterized protein Yka (UPF0111/DUF47 family)
MSWLTDFFKPRQDQFTRLLIEQAACVVKGLDALNVYVTVSNTKTGEAKASDAKTADLKAGNTRAADAKTADLKAGDAKAADAKTADPKAGNARTADATTGSALALDFRTNSARAADAVRQCEEEADEIRRILISELNRTFVTPIDREDISALSRAIDDIIDYAWTTVQEMEMLHVTPTPHLLRMVSLLREAAGEVHLAMLRLKDHPSVATEHAQRAKALENRVEHVYREAIADLFDGPAGPKRVIVILKMREVYRHLSNAADRGDAAANIISDIIVKMT